MSLADPMSLTVTQRDVAIASPADNRGEILKVRAALFRETPRETLQRIALGTVWSLMPRRITRLWPLAKVWCSEAFRASTALPSPETRASSSEFAGMVRDLQPPTLVAAYHSGLYPKGHFGPLKWMSPEERCVLFLGEYHISRRIRSIMRQGKYRVTFDRDFEGVIKACAARRAGRLPLTWITPRIMRAYAALFDAGHAHSFEVWNKEGQLVGGGYGVVAGGVFVIESQFSQESNTSKIGFSVLVWHLARWGFAMCDNKKPTPTVLQMGFRNIPRPEYLQQLQTTPPHQVCNERWNVEADAKIVADWNDKRDRTSRSPS